MMKAGSLKVILLSFALLTASARVAQADLLLTFQANFVPEFGTPSVPPPFSITFELLLSQLLLDGTYDVLDSLIPSAISPDPGVTSTVQANAVVLGGLVDLVIDAHYTAIGLDSTFTASGGIASNFADLSAEGIVVTLEWTGTYEILQLTEVPPEPPPPVPEPGTWMLLIWGLLGVFALRQRFPTVGRLRAAGLAVPGWNRRRIR